MINVDTFTEGMITIFMPISNLIARTVPALSRRPGNVPSQIATKLLTPPELWRSFTKKTSASTGGIDLSLARCGLCAVT